MQGMKKQQSGYRSCRPSGSVRTLDVRQVAIAAPDAARPDFCMSRRAISEARQNCPDRHFRSDDRAVKIARVAWRGLASGKYQPVRPF